MESNVTRGGWRRDRVVIFVSAQRRRRSCGGMRELWENGVSAYKWWQISE